MGTEDGRVQVVFNGEIYNYRDLRAELRALGHTFRTDCDTEAIVHAYEQWGTDAFRRFNGMWGIGILDRRGAAPKLVLCRDHFGIKPVYWARTADRLLFASEIKALLQDPSLPVRPNDQRILDYLVTGIHDHTGETFFAGVHQLQPGHWMSVDGAGHVHDEAYWEPVLTTGGDGRPEKFRELFLRSVERRLIADVPVGTCLSGGIDSSSIVMAMTELLRAHVPDARSMGDRLKTFSALFDGDPIDESEYINVVLAASGAESYEIRPTSERFFHEVEDFIWHVEEPTVSTGPYAQWCVQREAREQVTVLLDGQGGDELLAGYVPYQFFYLRELLRERKFGVLAREAWGARDTVGPAGPAQDREPPARAADPVAAQQRVGRPARPAAGPAQHRQPQAAPVAGPAAVQPALRVALRGPQLDGAQPRSPAALPRPGARGVGALAALRRHHPRRVEPLDQP